MTRTINEENAGRVMQTQGGHGEQPLGENVKRKPGSCHLSKALPEWPGVRSLSATRLVSACDERIRSVMKVDVPSPPPSTITASSGPQISGEKSSAYTTQLIGPLALIASVSQRFSNMRACVATNRSGPYFTAL